MYSQQNSPLLPVLYNSYIQITIDSPSFRFVQMNIFAGNGGQQFVSTVFFPSFQSLYVEECCLIVIEYVASHRVKERAENWRFI